ncbi:MAG: glycosyltransferase family 4 protein [Planctomycetes bacterium]|nr:glycosyltransferase family 4 protein [Planctomycetota bacterium]
MRIACVVEHYPQASELFIQREVECLRGLGHEVLLWPLVKTATPLWLGAHKESSFISTGNYLIPALQNMGKHPLLALRYGSRVAKAAGEIAPPELVYAHFASITAFCASALARLWKVPLVVSGHARDLFVPWQPGITAAKTADQVIVCSEVALIKAKELFPGMAGRIQLIHHGLPESAFVSSRGGNKPDMILAAGRLVPKKGFNLLLEAIAILKNRGKELCLRLAGEGPMREHLHNLVKHLSIQDRVEFLGMLTQQDLQKEIQQAAIFCAPAVMAPDNDQDGIPNVILEAMAAGLPVMACDAGGISEIVKDGVTGRLVASGSKELLAEALAASLPINDTTISMAKHAREFIQQNFSLRNNVEKLAQTLAKWAQ